MNATTALTPRKVLPAVPAAATLAVSILLAVAAFVAEPTTAELERKADAAMSAGDRATARVWFLRLLAQHPTIPRYQAGLRWTIAAQRGGG